MSVGESAHHPVHAPGLPTPIGPYSPAVVCNGLVFVSGQGATDPATGKPAGLDIGTQTEQVFRNIRTILEEAGSNRLTSFAAACSWSTCATSRP